MKISNPTTTLLTATASRALEISAASSCRLDWAVDITGRKLSIKAVKGCLHAEARLRLYFKLASNCQEQSQVHCMAGWVSNLSCNLRRHGKLEVYSST